MKKNEKIGYKVVARNLTSWNQFGKNDGEVKYKINKWVKPRDGCGPLAVFDELMWAQNMIGSPSVNDKIYECLYRPSRRRRLHDKEGNTAQGFRGTRYADAVKLIKRIA